MSISPIQLFESALLLPQAERADLAFQLLQSLVHPGDEVSQEEFGAELRERIAAQRRGELQSFDLDETRAMVRARLAQERAK